MASRLNLHEELCKILGNRSVYFQPPESVKLNFPCIIYERAGSNEAFADDSKYLVKKQYTVTVIDRNPDSEIPDKVGELQYSSFERFFISDNLNHFVFKIYY